MYTMAAVMGSSSLLVQASPHQIKSDQIRSVPIVVSKKKHRRTVTNHQRRKEEKKTNDKIDVECIGGGFDWKGKIHWCFHSNKLQRF